MAKRAAAAEAKPVNPRKKGLKAVTYRMEPAQIDALQREALKRAQERGSFKPDASELVREGVAEWLRRHVK